MPGRRKSRLRKTGEMKNEASSDEFQIDPEDLDSGDDYQPNSFSKRQSAIQGVKNTDLKMSNSAFPANGKRMI